MRDVNYSDPFGLCADSLHDKNGKCPGGLTDKEFDAAEAAARQHLKNGAQSRVLNLLYAGKIRGGRLALDDWGETGGRFSRTVAININRDYFDRESQSLESAFDLDGRRLAELLAHESEHYEQLKGSDFVDLFMWGLLYGTNAQFRNSVERDAESYARMNTIP